VVPANAWPLLPLAVLALRAAADTVDVSNLPVAEVLDFLSKPSGDEVLGQLNPRSADAQSMGHLPDRAMLEKAKIENLIVLGVDLVLDA
jgi:hypothetical protein